MTDLAKFAESFTPHRPTVAWLESLPEWDEILAAWNSGVEAQVIRAWLIHERGYDASAASVPKVNGHLQRKFPR